MADFLQCPLPTSTSENLPKNDMQPSTLVFRGHMCFSVGVSERILYVVSSFKEADKNVIIVFHHQTFIAHARSIFLLFQVFKFMSIIRVWDCSCEHWQPTGKLIVKTTMEANSSWSILEKSQLLSYANYRRVFPYPTGPLAPAGCGCLWFNSWRKVEYLRWKCTQAVQGSISRKMRTQGTPSKATVPSPTKLARLVIFLQLAGGQPCGPGVLYYIFSLGFPNPPPSQWLFTVTIDKFFL